MSDLVRPDEVLPGDVVHFRVGGSAKVNDVKHFIGSGIGHQLTLETNQGNLRYKCTGESLSSSPSLDIVQIDVTKENQDQRKFEEDFREVFGWGEKDEVLRGKCRLLYFRARELSA